MAAKNRHPGQTMLETSLDVALAAALQAATPAETIRRLRQIGAEYEAMREEPEVYGNTVAIGVALAAKWKVIKSTIHTASRLFRGYTAEQTEELCALIEEHDSSFGPTAMLGLAGTLPVELRLELARAAIVSNCGTTALAASIRAKRISQGRRMRGAGRLPQVPAAEPDRLAMLDGMISTFHRWYVYAKSRLPAAVCEPLAEADKYLIQAGLACQQLLIATSKESTNAQKESGADS